MCAHLLKRFCSDDRGNIALVFGSAVIPFLLATGTVAVTVAFDLDDADTVTRLEICASLKNPARPLDGRYAFTADTATELTCAFTEIGDILSEIVYLSQ